MEPYLSLTSFHQKKKKKMLFVRHALVLTILWSNLEGIRNRNPNQEKSESVKIAILMKLKI